MNEGKYKEMTTADKAFSMATCLFLRSVFGKEEYSESVIENLEWVVEELDQKKTDPKLLQTLWNELTAGSYTSPYSTLQNWVKPEMLGLGYSWPVVHSICQLLYKMFEINEFIHNPDRPVIQLAKDDNSCQMTNVLTRTLDILDGYTAPHFCMRMSETCSNQLDIWALVYTIGSVQYNDEFVITRITFNPKVSLDIIPEKARALAEKLIGRRLYFPKMDTSPKKEKLTLPAETERLIWVCGMEEYDELVIWKTNAPQECLCELGNVSCQMYADGGSYGDLPNWQRILTNKGYTFEFVANYKHAPSTQEELMHPEKSSERRAKRDYEKISEHYYIEN